MKTCNKCKETKELTEFHKDRASKDGLQGSCKPCVKARNKQYRKDNHEQALEYSRQWKAENVERIREYKLTPKRRYAEQRAAAKRRGVEWEFTFDTWWAVWEPHWEQRGREADQLCMARFGDTGPYHPDNVEIITNKQNHLDRQINLNLKKEGVTLCK